MNYAKIKKNDVANGEGICVSLFVQGCPHHCPGCFNSETWDFSKGRYFDIEIQQEIWEAITANGLQRNLSILGGEPLAPRNRIDVAKFIIETKLLFPDIKIYLWTGYILEELLEEEDYDINIILNQIDTLIDGPYIESERDITLHLCGSRNQRILTKEQIYDIINKKESEKIG